MSKAYLSTSLPNSLDTAFGSTEYQLLWNGNWISGETTESHSKVKMAYAGVLDKLQVKVLNNNIAATTTVRIRINGGNGNQSASITSNTTGLFTDSSNSDTISAGDDLDYSIVTGGASGNCGSNLWSCNFAATGKTAANYSLAYRIAVDAISTTRYMPLGGKNPFATESAVKTEVRGTYTAEKLYVNAYTNSSTQATTFTSRKNGADGNLTLSVTASTTGVFSDTTHSDSLVATDLYCVKWVSGTGTANVTGTAWVHLANTTNSLMELLRGGEPVTINKNTTLYAPLGSDINTNATEANALSRLGFSATLSFLRIYISANTVSSASTFNLRKGSADATQTCSITSNTTGLFEDTTHTDAVTATDDLDWKLVTPNSGTSLDIGWWGMTVSSSNAFTKSLTEAVIVANPTIRKLTSMTLSQVVIVVAVLAKVLTSIRVFTQSVIVNASAAASHLFFKTLTQAVSIIPTMIKVIGKALSQAVIIVPIFSRISTRFRAYTESIIVVSVRTAKAGKTFIEQVIVVPVFARVATFVRLFSQSLSIIPNSARMASRLFSQTIKIITPAIGTLFGRILRQSLNIGHTRLTTFLNGLEVGIWKVVARVQSAWSKIVREATGWTKIDRDQ